MKKLNYLASMLAALLMVGCTSNEIPGEPEPDPQDGRVLKINVETLRTKAEQPGGVDMSYTKIEDGVLYFFKDGGAAVYGYRLTDADLAVLAEANNQYKPVTVTGVPLSAVKVMLITNLLKTNRTSYPPFAGNNLTTLKAYAFEIQSQQPVGGVDTPTPLAEVVMSGDAAIFKPADSEIEQANISISPALSRLEIGSVRCKNVAGTTLPGTYGEGQITRFRLRGVFIPNHYEHSSVLGVGLGNPIKPTAPSDYTGTTFPNLLFDYFNGTSTLTKASKNYFAYHTAPSKEIVDMPNIVVAVDNVWFVDKDAKENIWANGGVQFFTVTEYNYSQGKLPRFEPAKIYRIEGKDPGTTTIIIGKDAEGNVIKDKDGKPVLFNPDGTTIGNPVDANNKPIAPINPNDPTTGVLNPIDVTLPGGTGGVEFGIGDLTDKPYDKNKTVQCNVKILPWNLVTITPAN